MYPKRFWIAFILGILAGVLCALGGNSKVPEHIRTMVFISVILNRAFIGFVIGVSAWRMSWILHGILLGLIGTLPMSVPVIFYQQAGWNAFIIYTVAGIIWGFLIELLTSLAFKAPMKKPES